MNRNATIAGELRTSHNGSLAFAQSEVAMPHRKIRDVVAGRKAHTTPSQTTVADDMLLHQARC